MADLVIDEIRLIEKGEVMTLPSDETLAEADVARLDVTDGQATGANGTTATEANFSGLVGAIDTGQVVTIWGNGCLVTLGTALAALSYGDNVFLSNTDKTLGTTAGTVSTKVGQVEAVRNQDTVYKALRIRKELN